MIKYIDPTKFEFRKETIELSRVIEKARLLRNSEFRVSEGVQGELKMRMVKELLTEKIASDIYQIEIPYKVEFPVSLWQYWKSRYAPQWFLDRFPVVVFEQTRTIRDYVCLNRKATYPMCNMELQEYPELVELLGKPIIKDEVYSSRGGKLVPQRER